jgi:hypothetical protein
MALTRGNSTKADLYAEIKLLKQANKDSLKIAKAQLQATFSKRYATFNKNKNKRIFSAKRVGYRSFDGIFSYITIVIYSKRVGVTPKQFCYIILLNMLNRMKIKDASVYGLGTYRAAHWILDNLCDLGLAEKFKQSMNVYYYASMKSKKIFDEYREFHNKGLKAIEEEYEYQQQRRKWKNKRISETG